MPPQNAPLAWQPQGPRPTTEGQVEQIADQEVVGAVQAIAAHPVDRDIVYIAAVNGGIWRTRNATAARPTWEPLTDRAQSLSLGAIEFDPADPTHRTLVAGTGRFSSKTRSGGALVGILRTTDAGGTWTVLGTASLATLHITGVAPRGDIIVVSNNRTGVHRTTDTGATWQQVSGTPASGLPAGLAFDLAGDPANPARLVAHVGASGLFRSTDTGATWTKISNGAIDALLGGATNVRISVGTANNIYLAICDGSSRLAGLFRSGDGGGTWRSLDLPVTIEGGNVAFGVHPGAQASIHLSVAADRDNPNLVYVGGDRQPRFDEGVPPGTLPRFPNSIGAQDFSGRLFRVDASKPSGNQSAPLTHNGTASGSAPHGDSRDMAIAPDGALIESDDGGVYRRLRPQTNTGDWVSMNGDLQVTEFHSVAWDANCRTVIGGAQDTGSPQQLTSAATRWRSFSTGDGGGVAVDAVSTPGLSTRYSSFQNLQALSRRVFNAAGTLLSTTPVSLLVLGGAPKHVAQFYTPLELNRVTPTRLIIGAANGVYESDDQGDTITAIAPGIRINDTGAVAYGAIGNSDVLYVGAGASVFVRTGAHPAALTQSAAYPGTTTVAGIAIVANDARAAFVVDATTVFHTTNSGNQWNNITGNLPALGVTVLRSVAFCADLGGGSAVVGTNNGVFAAAGPAFTQWVPLGTGLPAVAVLRLRYSDPDRTLLAGTLGRGAWTLTLPEPAIA